MAKENVQLLRRVYAEWGRGNWQSKFDFYDAGMEWGWSDEFPGLAGVYHDPAEPNARLRSWLGGWDDWRCEAEEYIARGDQVVVLTRYRGRGKGSGVPVDTKGAHVWALRDGKVVRLEIFADRANALAAAGLAD
jgi:ketosteroid isomerase-like protein